MSQNNLAYNTTRITLACVYLYFGSLKFFDGCSPAESLAGETVHLLSFKFLSAECALQSLAVFETVLGLLLLCNCIPKVAFILFLVHMLGTFAPLLLLPNVAFNGNPLMPTLVGQYIWKNIVYVSAVSAVFGPVVFAKKKKKGVTRNELLQHEVLTTLNSSQALHPQFEPAKLSSPMR